MASFTATLSLTISLVGGHSVVVAQGLPRVSPTSLEAHAHDTLLSICAQREGETDARLDELARALDSDGSEAVLSALNALEPRARAEASARPDDPAAQYRLAAVIGAKLDYQSDGPRISGAKELHAQLGRVLELSPDHAGASHILGRLHAGVLRLDRITRFFATRLLGGAALEDASWEEAQSRLELAERADPCVAEHHLELARVYRERDNPDAAQREIEHVMELTEGASGRDALIRERAEQLARRWRQGEG